MKKCTHLTTVEAITLSEIHQQFLLQYLNNTMK